MKIQTKNKIISFISSVITAYGVVALVLWDLNVGEWGFWPRLVYLLLYMAFMWAANREDSKR